MTAQEMEHFGKRFAYYATQADIDNATPWLLKCLRAEIDQAGTWIHGHVDGQEPMFDYTVGNPRNDPNPASGLPPVLVSQTPVVGQCVLLE